MRMWLAMIFVVLGSISLLTLGGIEGTMEYALDAPWRIEPSVNDQGQVEYGSIPIQISIHDTDLIDLDPHSISEAFGLGVPYRTSNKFSQFCSLTVKETDRPAVTYRLDQLAEIESSGPWLAPNAPPPTNVCRPGEAEGGCEGIRRIADTAEWHAVAWYTPDTPVPGSDIALTLTAYVTKSGASCSNADAFDVVRLRNHATVHLAEAALPRFDNRWLYGDLHYHSQGTDNEGESAYNHRGVIRAMGALGLDFALAAEHASNSQQIIDADFDPDLKFGCPASVKKNTRRLRDMSVDRFRFLRERLHGRRGINVTSAMAGANGRLPQGYLSHGVIPQLLLGGELDAIPEAETDDRYIAYGNKRTFDTKQLLSGTNAKARCGAAESYNIWEQTTTGWLVGDVQGLNEVHYGREHLIYLPGTGSDANAFVAGDTGEFGGARRRLADEHRKLPALLPEIERKRGYAFLAHPLNDGEGSEGPDGPPWSDFMIRKAWKSRAVLGMQFWNEPTHLRTSMRAGHAEEIGYDFGEGLVEPQLAESQRRGFMRGRFELRPYYDMPSRSFETWTRNVEEQLHHGAFTWDTWLLRGLDTNETSDLPWLPMGEPRRFFMAAGSDAHGDLNYRRAGYFLGTEKVTDVAIAKARNLVFAGDPDLPRDEDVRPDWAGKPAERYSHRAIVRAIADGNFTATDGPALRIAVDRNRNGHIDADDTPMGGVIELYGEQQLPMIVEWISTPEFGRVTRLSLYVGVHRDAVSNGLSIDLSTDASQALRSLTSRVYAPARHGPRNGAGLPGASVVESYRQGARTYARMADNYWHDPTGLLGIAMTPPSMSDRRSIVLPLGLFEAFRNGPGDRFYVRAFAETEVQNERECLITAQRGACIRHYAFTNPIWAITKTPQPGTCQPSARAFDGDRDGLPDGCDPCPHTAAPYCFVAPRSPAGGRPPVITRPLR